MAGHAELLVSLDVGELSCEDTGNTALLFLTNATTRTTPSTGMPLVLLKMVSRML